jgi:hypothetical protein
MNLTAKHGVYKIYCGKACPIIRGLQQVHLKNQTILFTSILKKTKPAGMTTKQKLLSFTIIKEAKYFLRQDCSSLLLCHSFSNNQRKGLSVKLNKKQKKNCSEVFATSN